MLIFPIIYFVSFLSALKGILQGDRQRILIFLIFGLSIYISALSIAFNSGFAYLIGPFQSFKEVLILLLLAIQIWTLKKRINLHLVDYLILTFFGYTLLYALLPIGQYGLANRLLAFKSTSFFALVYFSARLFDLKSLLLNKYFHYILFLAIAAAAVSLFEVISGQHLQIRTGYADFYYYVYNTEASGNYGLSWTFETSTGLKRLASFFANPIEHSAATVLALSVITALYTTETNKLKLDKFGIAALVATQISIFLAVSRASFISYFIMIYAYAVLTGKKYILNIIHFCLASAVVYVLFLLQNEDLQDFIITTVKFTDSSSIGHVVEWIEGITAITQNPLGMGLGASGRLGSTLQGNTGGENQFIILGVQAGIIAMILYITIYVLLIKTAWKSFNTLAGKEKKICLALLLMKIGLLIPMLTSELETSSYISYITWFFSGLFINVLANRNKQRDAVTEAI